MAGVPVRVLIADDQDVSAAATTAILDEREEFEVVGVAGCAAQAREFAAATRPHVALVDVRLSGGGEAAVEAVLAGSPATRVLARSGATDHEELVGMLQAGAGGYISREAPAHELKSALRGASAARLNGTGSDLAPNAMMAQLHAANRAHEMRISKRALIRRVMERDELEIVFQPIVALDSRAIVGYEALSRFAAEPCRGPEAWFADAHEVGLGPELELWAVRKACERSRVLPADVFMAVNVSPVTAERPDLLALLAACDVDHVVLEVTEHARVEDYARFRVALARVRALGASLAVDDAGAGFASLRHILELDAELIKRHGSLTRSLEADPRRRSLASALIEFGRESGASVLAEHIESELQLVELRRLGVQYGQGYHLGRPRPVPATVA